MFQVLDTILEKFRGCFSREAAFDWFVIVIVAFIVRYDHDGTKSVIRWLSLNPDHYDPLLRFFRNTSWDLKTLLHFWIEIVMESFSLLEINGRPLFYFDEHRPSSGP